MMGWRVGKIGEGDSVTDTYKMGNDPDFKNEQNKKLKMVIPRNGKLCLKQRLIIKNPG